MNLNKKTSHLSRIKLTRTVLKKFCENICHGSVSDLAKATGLPYNLLYNLAHGRIKSLSQEDSVPRSIWGEAWEHIKILNLKESPHGERQ